MNPDLERIDTYLEKVERSERETGIPKTTGLKWVLISGRRILYWWYWTIRTIRSHAKSRRHRYCGTG